MDQNERREEQKEEREGQGGWLRRTMVVARRCPPAPSRPLQEVLPPRTVGRRLRRHGDRVENPAVRVRECDRSKSVLFPFLIIVFLCVMVVSVSFCTPYCSEKQNFVHLP